MFETLKPAPQDKIIALIAEYAADERDGKIDLGVGVLEEAKREAELHGYQTQAASASDPTRSSRGPG